MDESVLPQSRVFAAAAPWLQHLVYLDRSSPTEATLPFEWLGFRTAAALHVEWLELHLTEMQQASKVYHIEPEVSENDEDDGGDALADADSLVSSIQGQLNEQR